jgi:hypothetical protein
MGHHMSAKKLQAEIIPLKKLKCAMCHKLQTHAYRPFCSRRCADLDLGKWLGGDYKVASDDQPDDETDYNNEE